MKKLPDKDSIRFNHYIQILTHILQDYGIPLELTYSGSTNFNTVVIIWVIKTQDEGEHHLTVAWNSPLFNIKVSYFSDKELPSYLLSKDQCDFEIKFTVLDFDDTFQDKLEMIGKLIYDDIKLNLHKTFDRL